jgi:hypothetical protein
VTWLRLIDNISDFEAIRQFAVFKPEKLNDKDFLDIDFLLD